MTDWLIMEDHPLTLVTIVTGELIDKLYKYQSQYDISTDFSKDDPLKSSTVIPHDKNKSRLTSPDKSGLIKVLKNRTIQIFQK